MSVLAENVPWFWPVVSRVVALLAIWLLLCVPAYLVLPFVRDLREAIARVMANLVERIGEMREERRTSRTEMLQRLCLDYANGVAIEARHQRWRAAVADLIDPLQTIFTRFEVLISRITTLARSLKIAFPDQALPSVPPAEDLNREFLKERLAWMNLVFATFVLLASIAVNIAMLGQILRDLELIPEHLRFASLPLTSVFAALLTIIEAGIGLLYATARDSAAENERSASIGSIATLVAGAAIAFVEGFFYSRIGSVSGEKKLIFELPFAGTEMTWESVFFLWGFVLVMTLFGFGVLLHRAAATIVRLGSTRRLRAYLKHFPRVLADRNTTLTALQKLLEATNEESSKAEVSLKSIADRAADLRRQLESEAQAMPSAASVPTIVPDAVSLHCRAGVWLGVTLGAAVLLLRVAPSWVWGAGLSLVAVVCGLAFAVRPTELFENFRFARRPRLVAAVLLAVVLTAVAAYAHLQLAVMVALAAALVVCAAQLARLVGVFGTWIVAVRDGAAGVLEGIVTLVGYLLLACAIGATYSAAMVAAPVSAVFRGGPSARS